MAEVELKDVVTGIEKLFKGHTHFVFWYDKEGEFADNIDELGHQLTEPIVIMQPRTQLKTKIELLDIEKAGGKALVYAAFSEPDIHQNLLTDMILYSKKFTADMNVMLLHELGLPETELTFVQAQRKFFAAKTRIAKFKQRYQRGKNPEQVELAAIAKTNDLQLSNILIEVIKAPTLLDEFAKYQVLETFWSFVDRAYGYHGKHDLQELLATMMVNFAYYQMELDLPVMLRHYEVSYINNVVSFMLNWRNRNDTREVYKQAAAQVWRQLDGQQIFKNLKIADLLKADTFIEFDRHAVKWLISELLAGHLGEVINHMTLPEIAEKRGKMYFSPEYQLAYRMTVDAHNVLLPRKNRGIDQFDDLIEAYITEDYLVDTAYRQYINALDQLPATQVDLFDNLSRNVESAYNNEHLVPMISDWCQDYVPNMIEPQRRERNFYSSTVGPNKDRTVVIISDAFRFEAAKELQQKLDERDVFGTDMQYAVTGLPSVTYFGKPSLLPNHELVYQGNKELLVDGQKAINLEQRLHILQTIEPQSQAMSFKNFLSLSSIDQKKYVTDQKVIYFYHDTVDATGDKPVSEADVFRAVEDAIAEIERGIDRLRTISIRNIYVTADHGFIYRRHLLDSTDKINLPSDVDFEQKNLRYAIGSTGFDEIGVDNVKLGDVLGNDDQRFVFYPSNANVFSVPGAGQNYVHGGCSPQEMIIPVLHVTTESRKSQATYATLAVTDSSRRITSHEVIINMVQNDPVDETHRAATYALYFVDGNGRQISGEQLVHADITSINVNDRLIRRHIPLIDQDFERGGQYQLVIKNVEANTSTLVDYQMDLTVGGGFDFDI
ncbi:BREX-1 system phosphatase PglZ type A [Lacticaseibacillus paracasei]|uniref:BREX-1 system phosphatase PglZ type A n=1 Tax=Lacticaseibacillus paracasei TaxID=1597 RepID=UPI00209F8113|nr:BREX-1 system phosphatase PglZ type A [Lacticaseibacillus paracasei]UVH24445.1 BREX-1 system phosphatase PglZ type A [Lacticaseibacillus paracasei]